LLRADRAGRLLSHSPEQVFLDGPIHNTAPVQLVAKASRLALSTRCILAARPIDTTTQLPQRDRLLSLRLHLLELLLAPLPDALLLALHNQHLLKLHAAGLALPVVAVRAHAKLPGRAACALSVLIAGPVDAATRSPGGRLR